MKGKLIMRKKYDYFLAVVSDDGSLSYVTKINNTTKSFLCEPGKPAMKFTKTVAEDIHQGMVMNFCPAVIVVSAADCINFFNPVMEGDSGNE